MYNTEIGPWLQAPATISVPTFAIGDVHGRFDLLEAMLGEIAYLTGFDALSSGRIITLGDYIDRGPQGLAALALALDGTDIPGFESIPLPGNHEQFLRQFLECDFAERPRVMRIWFRNGGVKIVHELELEVDQVEGNPLVLVNKIKDFLGEERLRRFLTLKNHFRQDRYLFVHGGIHPRLGLAMLDQDWNEIPYREETDPLWVRGPFLTHEGPHDEDVIVVHGHTPRDLPELLPNRIGIDTLAYNTDRLTAVELRDDKLRFIQVHAPKFHTVGDLPLD